MKFKNLIFVGAMMLTVTSGVQAQEDLRKIFEDSYQRALRYNDRAEAKSALYRIIAMDPQSDSLATTLAYIYFEARQYASSVLVCMDALQMNPNNIGALEISALSYENLGIKDKALDNYEKLYLKTEGFQALYKMAFLQYDLEKYQQSSTNIDILLTKPEMEEATISYTVEEVEKEFPIKVALLNLKGLANKELGNLELARQSFEEALAISPDFALAQENMDALNV